MTTLADKRSPVPSYVRQNQRRGRGPNRRHRANSAYLSREAVLWDLPNRLDSYAEEHGISDRMRDSVELTFFRLILLADDQTGIIVGPDWALATQCRRARRTFTKHRDILIKAGELTPHRDPKVKRYLITDFENLVNLRPRKAMALPDKIRKGARHSTFWQYACSLRGRGYGEEGILLELRENLWRAEQPRDDPFGDTHLAAIAKDVAARYHPNGSPEWIEARTQQVSQFLERVVR